MDTNALVEYIHEAQCHLWVSKVNESHRTGSLCPWVSTFHPQKLSCHLEGTFHHGAFNAGVKMVFSNRTAWMVRFPRAGMVCDEYADEKIAMEVSALKLIRERTTIPVPRVHAYGPSASNTLGLGPFIMMDFIEGVSLSQLLQDANAERPSRVMREDISDKDTKTIYRQMARFMLQLFKLDFDEIGSLPLPRGDGFNPAPPRPLTFKSHCILQNGGIDTFGNRALGFATTTEYFQHLVKQDLEQLDRQPNSVVGSYDAKNKYLAFKALESLIPGLVNPKYDRCKFKLICDDLGLANLIVRAEDDLTVIGVMDLEWSYIGPAQIFGSAPWWLLQDRPVNSAWDYQGDRQPRITKRYFKYLDIFMRVLEEEEVKVVGDSERELSSLVKWSRDSGAMWMHMLLTSGFNDHRSFPFKQLHEHLGTTKWERLEADFDSAEQLDAFAARKVAELDMYDEALETMEENKALVDSGVITQDQFISQSLILLNCLPWTSSITIAWVILQLARVKAAAGIGHGSG
ncbi:hypothetical protein BJX64DRAFT_296895 [Aspergillus heterothallicus]